LAVLGVTVCERALVHVFPLLGEVVSSSVIDVEIFVEFPKPSRVAEIDVCLIGLP